MKPKRLTLQQIKSGGLPTWCDDYSDWLSSLPSFQNETNRASMGRIKALRSLSTTLREMLPSEFSDNHIVQLVSEIRAMAKLKANNS